MTQFFTNPQFPPPVYEGPLGDIMPAYAAVLYKQGYTQQSAHLQLRFLAALSYWLDHRGLRTADITEKILRQYLRSRHQRFRPRRDDASILKRILRLLHIDTGPRPINSPRQRVEDDFDRYLNEERGLSMATRINYRPFIRQFLLKRFGARPLRLANLRAPFVIQFVRNRAHGMSPKRAD